MSGETFKGGAHFMMGGFALALGLYNVMRYAEDRHARNLLNAGAYALLVGLEAANTRHHWQRT